MHKNEDYLILLGNNIRLNLLKNIYYNEGSTLKELCYYLKIPSSKYSLLLYHVRKLVRQGIIYKDKNERLYLTKNGKILLIMLTQIMNLMLEKNYNDSFLFFNDGSNIKLDVNVISSYLMNELNIGTEDSLMLSQRLFEELKSRGKLYYTLNSLMQEIIKIIIKNNILNSHQFFNKLFITVIPDEISAENYVKKVYESLGFEYFLNKIASHSHLEYLKNNYIYLYPTISSFLHDIIDGYLEINIPNEISAFSRKLNMMEKIIEKALGGINLLLSYKRMDHEKDEFMNKLIVFWLNKVFYDAFLYKKLSITFAVNEMYEFMSDFEPYYLSEFGSLGNKTSLLSELILKISARSSLKKDCFDFILPFMKVLPSFVIHNSFDTNLTAFHCVLEPEMDAAYVNSLISLNLPKIFIDVRYKEKLFYDKLQMIIKDIFKLFDRKYDICKKSLNSNNLASNLTFNFMINLVGAFEYVYLLTGKTIIDDESIFKEYKRVFGIIGKTINDLQSDTGYSVKLCSVNDGISSFKFLDKSLLKSLISLPSNFKAYMTLNGLSYGILPPCVKFVSLDERIEKESTIATYLTGGYDFVIWLNNMPTTDGLVKLYMILLERKIRTIELNFIVSVCNKCANRHTGLVRSCNKCGSNSIYYIAKFRNKIYKLLQNEIRNISINAFYAL